MRFLSLYVVLMLAALLISASRIKVDPITIRSLLPVALPLLLLVASALDRCLRQGGRRLRAPK